MKVINSHNQQYVPHKTAHSVNKQVIFTGKPDKFESSSNTDAIVADLLENTSQADWNAPLFSFNKNIIAERTLKHPDHGKIAVKILLRNLADERGGECYSPNFNEAVITIPKKGIKLASTDLNSDLFKLAIKATAIKEDLLIQPLDPSNPPKGY